MLKTLLVEGVGHIQGRSVQPLLHTNVLSPTPHILCSVYPNGWKRVQHPPFTVFTQHSILEMYVPRQNSFKVLNPPPPPPPPPLFFILWKHCCKVVLRNVCANR